MCSDVKKEEILFLKIPKQKKSQFKMKRSNRIFSRHVSFFAFTHSVSLSFLLITAIVKKKEWNIVYDRYFLL
jgi:hypothetical protein